jgi:dihydrofolate synthase/folylpolyglutamate synthase
MTYPEAIQFLYSLRLFGLKLGLENTFKLAAMAGNPQERLRFIHVAGTNGKGSTCAMLESIYRTAGLRVGLFTSPHLVSFRERIQVDREWIGEADVVRLVDAIRGSLKGFPADHHPTFFEVLTVMALRYFTEQNCDLVIWETGMGGRLDATNIVIPLASVITNIEFDHQNWLGATKEQIATEKAGIIKPGVPVITATIAPEALIVIEETARKLNAPLTTIGHASGLSKAGETPALPLLGEHQRLNATLAVATVQAIRDKIPVSDDSIRRGLETVEWPGRFQLLTVGSGLKILLDGAHNPASSEALRIAFLDLFPDIRPTFILGMLEDKDWPQMCGILAPLASRILLAPVSSDRTATPEPLRDACQKINPDAETIACPSLENALNRAANDPFVVITGSLYLVGEAMELLKLSPPGATSERGLNEWTFKK